MTEHREDDDFLARLRADAAPLRYRVDDVALGRIRARIQERIASPTVASLLASWLRPLAAAVTAVAIVAALTLTVVNDDTSAFGDDNIEIVVAGDTYVVGN